MGRTRVLCMVPGADRAAHGLGSAGFVLAMAFTVSVSGARGEDAAGDGAGLFPHFGAGSCRVQIPTVPCRVMEIRARRAAGIGWRTRGPCSTVTPWSSMGGVGVSFFLAFLVEDTDCNLCGVKSWEPSRRRKTSS